MYVLAQLQQVCHASHTCTAIVPGCLQQVSYTLCTCTAITCRPNLLAHCWLALLQVKLAYAGDLRSGAYSGGMKRRLRWASIGRQGKKA